MRNLIINNEKIQLDNGYFFGRGAFETILIKNHPIFLKEHIDRLNKAIEFLNIGETVDIRYIGNILDRLNLKNCALKLVVTEKNIVFQSRPLTYTSGDYLRGFSLKISEVSRNSTSKINNIKSTNYLENILEREEAIKKNYDEVIFFNEKGYLAEGSVSNIFVVSSGEIFTPGVEEGLLQGTVREYLLGKYHIKEKKITREDLINADEVFITNSLLGIMGVSKIEDKIFSNNKMTNKIREEYEAEIDV